MEDIILFDIDGTLTVSTKPLTDEMINTIKKLYYNGYILGIVSGAVYKKIKKQLKSSIVYFKYILCECGTIIYENGSLIRKKKFRKNCNKKVLNELIKVSLQTISTMPITYGGNHIDMRYSMLYVSLPGTSASHKMRSEFMNLDKDLGLRKTLLEKLVLVDKNNDFDITFGGSVGISINIKGWNKSLAGDYLRKELKLENNIYFFGDKTSVDGNDYPLYSYPGIVGISVVDYNDTINKLANMFKI